jgi:hypothetical protein
VKNYIVKRYNSEYFTLWNDFISTAKNATFLFHRDYMEYHSDRFEDYSLLVFDGGKLVSIIPANRIENSIFSHQGLTYGGFVFDDNLNIIEMNTIISKVVIYLKENRFGEFLIKEMVSIYAAQYFNEIRLMLLEKEAKLSAAKMNLAIDFESEFKISKSKLKHYRRLQSIGLEIREEDSLDNFWDKVLIPRLAQRFNSKPVHTLEEITFLKRKFPDNIFQYNVYLENEILAGITIFKTDKVIKSQYGAITKSGEKFRALDFLYINLINKFKTQYAYFDMGTVDDDSELGYNIGLLNQKKELGCIVFEQNFYRLKL